MAKKKRTTEQRGEQGCMENRRVGVGGGWR